ncbi:hypothetical protein F5B19DRAFT_437257 [Rostrohypoxylon terebratum]|nr:hypothetical protein F5B19DRAFT_437257 [Rostrohypoxylon terebratum]
MRPGCQLYLGIQSPCDSQRNKLSTFRTMEEFKNFENQAGWRPGAEPGIDPSKPDGGQSTAPSLQAQCHITVVDFSQEDLQAHQLSNHELIDFVKVPQPSWAKCRWINVNGLSWDVIQALGAHKNLDPLNIEDTMTTENLPKVDWHQDQAFITLTCQKLVHQIEDEHDNESNGDKWNSNGLGTVKSMTKKIRKWFVGEEIEQPPTPSSIEKGFNLPTNSSNYSSMSADIDLFNPNRLCTLQGYRASRNVARTEYMEDHSVLAPRGLAVMVEQVSLFMTKDTVISFFEQSADDVEKPILARLSSKSTVIRQSCCASMVVQAILDAIIDMAMPVTSCYADVLGDLELDVLQRPNTADTQKLYVIINDINKIFGLINPIQTLVKTLRDRAKLAQKAATQKSQNFHQGITISSITYPYLGDVYDHCVLVTGDLSSLKQSAENMSQLIFNTVMTKQSSTMTSLSIMSAIILPLMLMTSYFGQNFHDFPAVNDYDVRYFWHIAIPVVIGTILIIKYNTWYEFLGGFFQRGRKRRVRKVRWAKVVRKT